jgi:hypothetical protein
MISSCSTYCVSVVEFPLCILETIITVIKKNELISSLSYMNGDGWPWMDTLLKFSGRNWKTYAEK